MKDKQLFPSGNPLHQEKEQTTDEYHIRWGNLSAVLSWNNQFNHKLTGNFSLVYARNLSKYDFRSDDSFIKGKMIKNILWTGCRGTVILLLMT